eukprot:SAG31_NODE_208_length_20313_cov_6.143119_17_plen_73_part_00
MHAALSPQLLWLSRPLSSRSPLVLGFDLTNHTLYDELYPIVANRRIISINQQFAGNSGVLTANSSEYFRCAF